MKRVTLTDAQAEYVFHLVNNVNSFHDHELPFSGYVAERVREAGFDVREARKGLTNALINNVEDVA